MPTDADFRAALERALPIRAAAGELTLSVEPDAVRLFNGVCVARIAWRDAEAVDEGREPYEHLVTFGNAVKGDGRSPVQVEALLLAVRDVLAIVSRERALAFPYSSTATWLPHTIINKKSLATREQYFNGLIDALGLQDLLLTDEDRAARISIEELYEIVKSVFPAQGGRCELALAEWGGAPRDARPGERVLGAVTELSAGFKIELMFIVYEEHDGKREVRDIKSQEVYLLPSEHRRDKARVRAYFEGLADGISALFRQRTDDRFIDGALPHTLADGSLVNLKRARTREDFFLAYCKRKKIEPVRG
jgi:hypothetical protein